jgi:hypothetical protein
MADWQSALALDKPAPLPLPALVFTKVKFVAIDNRDPNDLHVWVENMDTPDKPASKLYVAQGVLHYFTSRAIGLNSEIAINVRKLHDDRYTIMVVDRAMVNDQNG